MLDSAQKRYIDDSKTKFYCYQHGISDTRCDCPEFKEGNPVRQVTEYTVTPRGTWYKSTTAPEVMVQLDLLITSDARVRIFLGDQETGKSWNEENDVIGTIGRTTGPIREPLMIANSRSRGGGAILTDCILLMRTKYQILYQHPKYVATKFDIREHRIHEYPFAVYADDEEAARFKTYAKADRWMKFMKGERMSK